MKRTFYYVASIAFLLGAVLLLVAYQGDPPSVVLDRQLEVAPPLASSRTPDQRGSDASDMSVESSRTLVALGGCTFLVRERVTNRPVPHAIVCTAQMGHRGGRSEQIGTTGEDGRLATDLQLDESRSYFARVNNYVVPFGLAHPTDHDQPTYVAWASKLPTLRLSVTERNGSVIAGARLSLSRKPIAEDLETLWGYNSEITRGWVPSEEIDAIYVGLSDEEGLVEIGVSEPGRYFWSLSKQGFIPWGNEVGHALDAPGYHGLTMSRLAGAALDIRGDEVVSLRAVGFTNLHDPSIDGLVRLQGHLKRSLSADLVVLTADEPMIRNSTVKVDLFLRHSGHCVLEVPVTLVDKDFSPYLHRLDHLAGSRRLSGSVHLTWKSADGGSIDNIRWRLFGQGTVRAGVGEKAIELRPGAYAIQPTQRALSAVMPKQPFTIEAAGQRELQLEIPDSLVRTTFRITTESGIVDVPGSTTLIVRREGVEGELVESYRTSGLSTAVDLWLPVGRLHITTYAPSYVVSEAWVEVQASRLKDGQECELFARDL